MASFRKRGPYQWQAQVRRKGRPPEARTLDTRAAAEQWAREVEHEMDRGTFVSRAEAESTNLRKLLERYRDEVTPLKKGAAPETNRLNALLRHPLANRIVATRGATRAPRERLQQDSRVSTMYSGRKVLPYE